MKPDPSVDTIVAPATAAGEGGIGIVRLSGTSAETTLQRFFRSSRPTTTFTSHRLYHGRLYDPEDRLIDEVMAVVMRGPRSYTGDDVVEIHCHGGQIVVRRILDLFIDAGIRLARPGEFTLRAFLNGRLDLARAEAVIDVIRARSDAACDVALRQLDGLLSREIHRLRDRLVDHLSLIEAHIDFPDEDIAPPLLASIVADVTTVGSEIQDLLAGFDQGRVLREGLNVLILGRPNVGKSSLLNALLGESRAIVTEVPGTTRDTVEENLVLGGLPIRLIDTAGVRDTTDPVESEGVRRASDKCASADLVLLVVDGSQPVHREDRIASEMARNRKTLLVLNKCDLPSVELTGAFARLPAVAVSAKTGVGLDRLREAIASLFTSAGDAAESTLVSDRRHREALVRTAGALDRFLASAASDGEPEFLALDLQDALQALGEITGETTPDEILDRIFSRFCIGK